MGALCCRPEVSRNPCTTSRPCCLDQRRWKAPRQLPPLSDLVYPSSLPRIQSWSLLVEPVGDRLWSTCGPVAFLSTEICWKRSIRKGAYPLSFISIHSLLASSTSLEHVESAWLCLTAMSYTLGFLQGHLVMADQVANLKPCSFSLKTPTFLQTSLRRSSRFEWFDRFE